MNKDNTNKLLVNEETNELGNIVGEPNLSEKVSGEIEKTLLNIILARIGFGGFYPSEIVEILKNTRKIKNGRADDYSSDLKKAA